MTDVLLDVAIRDLKNALNWVSRGDLDLIVDGIIDRIGIVLRNHDPDLHLPMLEQDRIAALIEDTVHSHLDPELINAAVDVLLALGEDVRHLKVEV